jgi:hypothetical protein
VRDDILVDWKRMMIEGGGLINVLEDKLEMDYGIGVGWGRGWG